LAGNGFWFPTPDPSTGIFARANNTPQAVAQFAMSSRFSQCAALDAGADAYITKPYSPKHLVQCIQGLLQRVAAPANPPQTSFGSVGGGAYTCARFISDLFP
jgi:DNA-binding response OmpR family regulator